MSYKLYVYRYFYLRFDDSLSARITDIGVHVRRGDGTYLGAIHIHEGFTNKPDQKLDNIKMVSKVEYLNYLKMKVIIMCK